MVEVEVKAQVSNIDKLKETLIANGYVASGVIKEEDQYFNAPDRDFRNSDEALRIRKQGNKIYMTYKGKKLDDVSMARVEIETEITDFEAMKQILLSLGYKPTIPVVKVRESFRKDNLLVCVDTVENLGTFMELEICVEDDTHRECALEHIKKELAQLGYSMEDTTRTSYLSMLEEIKRS